MTSVLASLVSCPPDVSSGGSPGPVRLLAAA